MALCFMGTGVKLHHDAGQGTSENSFERRDGMLRGISWRRAHKLTSESISGANKGNGGDGNKTSHGEMRLIELSKVKL